MAVKLGEIVPDFTLPASDGTNITLSDYRGKKVVLYFYPRNMTPGCTTEACDFRDYNSQIAKLDAVVLGVSPDPIKSHHKFITKYELPFSLLSDENHEVSELFGVWQLKKLFGREYMGIVRSTFIIDEEGRLLHEWSKVKVAGHAAEVYSTLLEGVGE